MRRNILNGWLWKQAEQMADDRSIKPGYNEMGFAMLPHLRRDRVKAAYIKRGEFGGWIGDIVLKNMPLGCPDMCGTAVSHPAKSEAEARKTLIHPLIFVGT